MRKMIDARDPVKKAPKEIGDGNRPGQKREPATSPPGRIIASQDGRHHGNVTYKRPGPGIVNIKTLLSVPISPVDKKVTSREGLRD